MLQLRDDAAKAIDLTLGKVVCVGRNYLDHINELNNEVPDEPLLFIKPATAVVDMAQPLQLPQGQGACHNELEVAVLIQKTLRCADENDIAEAIWGYGLGLDLTLRDKQSQLKAKGQPWERAKAFDGSCPLSAFVPANKVPEPQSIDFTLEVNGHVRQQGNTEMMMHQIVSLLLNISHTFTLLPGDVVMTGTPKGVGPLQSGDKLTCRLASLLTVNTEVSE